MIHACMQYHNTYLVYIGSLVETGIFLLLHLLQQILSVSAVIVDSIASVSVFEIHLLVLDAKVPLEDLGVFQGLCLLLLLLQFNLLLCSCVYT